MNILQKLVSWIKDLIKEPDIPCKGSFITASQMKHPKNCVSRGVYYFKALEESGVKARRVYGKFKTKNGWEKHCWVEILQDEKWIMYDPSNAKKIGFPATQYSDYKGSSCFYTYKKGRYDYA